jgi:hypothetical protein
MMAVLLLQNFELELAPNQVQQAVLVLLNGEMLNGVQCFLLCAPLTCDDEQEVQYKSAITLSAKNGIRMLPRPRKSATSEE